MTIATPTPRLKGVASGHAVCYSRALPRSSAAAFFAAAAIFFAALAIAPSAARASDTTEGAAETTTTAASGALGIEDLVRIALDKNLRVQIDEVRIGEARALLQLAEAQAYPRISAQTLFGGPTPEAKTRVLNDPSTVTPESLEGDFDFGAFGVTLRAHADAFQPLYTFGKIGQGKEAAANVVRAAEKNADITRATVVFDVHRAFWAYQLTRSFISSLDEGVEILEKVLEKVRALLDRESPQVTENDRLRLTHALATVRVRRSEAAMGNAIAEKAIKLMIHKPQEEAIAIAEADLDAVPETIPALETVLKELPARRPELRALASLVEAHRHYASLQRRLMLPDIFLGGFIDYALTTSATNQTNPFIRDDFNFFNSGIGLGLRVELDIWNKLAVAEQADAALATRMAELAAAAEAVDLEVRKIHTEASSYSDRVPLLEKAHVAARGWLAASVLAYDIGTGDAGELIDAFVARATAEGELLKTLFDLRLSLVDLERASGRLLEHPEGPRLSTSPSE